MKIFSFLTTAFIPHLPQKLFLSELERLVAMRAFGNSFIENIYSEISFDRIALEMANMHCYSSNIGIFSILLICFYGQYKYNLGETSIKNNKFEDIDIYSRYARILKEVLFIVFLVFTRDIQNAT